MSRIAILAALCCAGCGGGGSSTNPAGVPTEVQTLADCTADTAAIFAAVLDRLALVHQAAADPGSPPAGISFPVADAMSGAVQFQADIDLDGDAAADGALTGNSQFLHTSSGPGLPMPDGFLGYTTTTTWDLDVGGQISSGSVQAEFTNASGSQASLATGLGTLQTGADCAVTFMFAAATADDDVSDFPTGDVSFDASAGGETLTGTLAFDGTATASGTASFGGTDYVFDVDLLTGSVQGLAEG